MIRVEELMTEEIVHPSNPLHHARALAHRALIRMRLKQWTTAVDDAKEVTFGFIHCPMVVLTIAHKVSQDSAIEDWSYRKRDGPGPQGRTRVGDACF